MAKGVAVIENLTIKALLEITRYNVSFNLNCSLDKFLRQLLRTSDLLQSETLDLCQNLTIFDKPTFHDLCEPCCEVTVG